MGPESDKNCPNDIQPLGVIKETFQDCLAIGKLIATKVVLNEFNAFADLQHVFDDGQIEKK